MVEPGPVVVEPDVSPPVPCDVPADVPVEVLVPEELPPESDVLASPELDMGDWESEKQPADRRAGIERAPTIADRWPGEENG